MHYFLALFLILLGAFIPLMWLRELWWRKITTNSLGMRQRYGIAVALIGNPEVLILDEPTNGLDIEGLKEMRNLLEDLKKSGVTMLISSHILGDLYKIAEQFFFMRKGKVVEQWTHEEIEEKIVQGKEIEELFASVFV